MSTYADAAEAAIATTWVVLKDANGGSISIHNSEWRNANEFIWGARAGAAVIAAALGYEPDPDQINKLLGLVE